MTFVSPVTPDPTIRPSLLQRAGPRGQVIDRRAFLGTLALLAAPLVAEAQPARRAYRIALIASGTPTSAPSGQVRLLSDRLQELGWTYGRDFIIEQRAYGNEIDRIPDLAAELLRTGVDVFVVEGAYDARRVQQVTHTIPIVTLRAGDIMEAGLAASLARPGGNVTGIQTLQPQLAGKHLSLLKEAIPRLSRSGILFGGRSMMPSYARPKRMRRRCALRFRS